MSNPTPPPMPPYFAPVPPPRKRSKAPLILGIIAGVFVVCIGGVIGLVAILGASAKVGQNVAESKSVGLNQPARDGKFEFKVSAVTCGIPSVGGQYLGHHAQGQYCKVSMTVVNIGNKAQMLSDSNMYAFNAKGQRYETSSDAIFMEDDGHMFLEDINPGNAVVGTMLFDIPVGQTITKLELHDSPFSGGVTVKL